MRLLVTLLLSAVVALGGMACGNDESDVPEGDPLDVVAAAPDKTTAAGSVGFSATTVDAVVEGTLDLATGRGTAELEGPELGERRTGVPVDFVIGYLGTGAPIAHAGATESLPPQLVGTGPQPGNPLVALDLLRGVTEAIPYGGSLVRGNPAFRYEVILDPAVAAARAPVDRRAALERLKTPLEGDVWIDRHGRARRLQVGNDLTVRTTTTDRRGAPVATTIDLYDFKGD
jgi:hypothetical protein